MWKLGQAHRTRKVAESRFKLKPTFLFWATFIYKAEWGRQCTAYGWGTERGPRAICLRLGLPWKYVVCIRLTCLFCFISKYISSASYRAFQVLYVSNSFIFTGPWKVGTALFPFCRCGNWDTRRLKQLFWGSGSRIHTCFFSSKRLGS